MYKANMSIINIKSKIKNINIVIGCTNNCPYCYARCSAKRFHMTHDFSIPQFYENKLRLLTTPTPSNFLLTGMSDFADWKDEWMQQIFGEIAANPQNNYIFLTKSPERKKLNCDLPNAWFGVTVTCKADIKRIQILLDNIKCKHYHVTFEPLFEDLGVIDLSGIDWIVVGTETGNRKGKITAKPEWVNAIANQASTYGARVFMKEELAHIMGEDNMIQQLPPEFIKE